MIAETKRYEKELKRIQKLKEKQRKKQLEIQRDMYIKKLMNERDIKNQGRGLRQRTKTNENDEEFPMGAANSNYDQNMQDLQNEDNTENPDKAIQDVKMQID